MIALRKGEITGKTITNRAADHDTRHSVITSTPTVLGALKRTLQELLGSDRWYGTMELITRGEKKKEKKIEKNKWRRWKKEQKRKERNAKIRRRNKDREIAYYVEEAEYYLEERAYYEEQHDDYHRNYIEEVLNDICKRLYLRSQPARTARHSRWKKEMQLRREQKEEQATETEIITYETEQQQEKRSRTARKGRRSRNLITLLR
jgi:hypothetical protein